MHYIIFIQQKFTMKIGHSFLDIRYLGKFNVITQSQDGQVIICWHGTRNGPDAPGLPDIRPFSMFSMWPDINYIVQPDIRSYFMSNIWSLVSIRLDIKLIVQPDIRFFKVQYGSGYQAHCLAGYSTFLKVQYVVGYQAYCLVGYLAIF